MYTPSLRHLTATALAGFLLPLATGCPTPDDPLDVVVEISPAVGTVVTLRWDTDAPSQGYVQWGIGEDLDRRIDETAADTEHEVQLRGNVAQTEYTFRVVGGAGDDRVGQGTFETDPLPIELQGLSLSATADAGEALTDGYFFTPIIGELEVPVVFDRQGHIVWYHLDDDEMVASKRVMQVVPSCDGRHVYYNRWKNAGDDGRTYIVRTSWDGLEYERFAADGHHHAFTVTGDDTVLALFNDNRQIDGQLVMGDAIGRLADDGSWDEFWSAFDDLEVDFDLVPDNGWWTHANVVDFDGSDGAIYISLRTLDAIVKLDGAGDLQWVFGGPYSDFDSLGDDAFAQQHGFHVLEDSIVVFDNNLLATPSQPDLESRALEIAIDPASGATELLWAHANDLPWYAPAGGDVQRLDDGNTLVTWGFAGQIDEVTPDGRVVWQANGMLGENFFYVEFQPDLYSPTAPRCRP